MTLKLERGHELLNIMKRDLAIQIGNLHKSQNLFKIRLNPFKANLFPDIIGHQNMEVALDDKHHTNLHL